MYNKTFNENRYGRHEPTTATEQQTSYKGQTYNESGRFIHA